MRYTRKHGQQNLQKEDVIKTNPQLLDTRIEPEVFDNVTEFNIITTSDYHFYFRDGDEHEIEEIIEGNNLFVFISRTKNKIISVKYDSILSFDFTQKKNTTEPSDIKWDKIESPISTGKKYNLDIEGLKKVKDHTVFLKGSDLSSSPSYIHRALTEDNDRG